MFFNFKLKIILNCVLFSRIIDAIEQMLTDDINDNMNIGQQGANEFLSKNPDKKAIVLTHCNTGSLATAGYGTALGVIRTLHKMNQIGEYLSTIFCNQELLNKYIYSL